MFTNNYIAYKKMMFSGGNAYNSKHPERLYFTEVGGSQIGGNNNPNIYSQYSYHGDIGYWLNNAKCASIASGSQSSEVGGVYFGGGSTPPTKDDIALENPITSGLTITNQSTYTFSEDENGNQVYSASYILTNNTDADINIWEVGVFTSVSKSSSQNYTVLMERSVFPEVVVVPAGGAKLITLKFINNSVLNVE